MKRMLFAMFACLLMMSCCAMAEGKVYEVSTLADFEYYMENAEDGSIVKVMKDILIDDDHPLDGHRIRITSDLTLDMNGKTLRDARTDENNEIEMTLDVRQEGSLKIVGDGVFEKMDHHEDFLQVLGPVEIYSGTFRFDSFKWDKAVCKKNYNQLGILINSHYKPSEGYYGTVNVYGGTFDSGVTNPQDVIDYHASTDKRKVCYLMYPILNEGNTKPHGVTVYGGTFVTANPVNGEGNWTDGVGIENPWYLKGQTELGVTPDPYTITESTGSDGRISYTASYPVKVTAQKALVNNTAEEASLAGFNFEMVDSVTGKTFKAVSDEDGEVEFSLTTVDMENPYILREAAGNDPQITYSELEYEVRIVPGELEDRFAPVVEYYLDGKEVDEPVFENTVDELPPADEDEEQEEEKLAAAALPQTGDTQSMALYLALAAGSVLMIAALQRGRRRE